MIHKSSLVYIPAGGKGERLMPLTKDRAKPAMPFGGSYRVIDCPLNNCFNSGFQRIVVLTQYRSGSLHKHLKYGWYPRFGSDEWKFLEIRPAMQGPDLSWYEGTADAVMRNAEFMKDLAPDNTLIFGGDHIYLMDVRDFDDFHNGREADLTISAIRVRRDLARGRYGVLEINREGRVIGFEEKPDNPKPLPDDTDSCLASMGNYEFRTEVLLDELLADSEKDVPASNGGAARQIIASDPKKYTSHDFGYDIIPGMLRSGQWRIFAYDFSKSIVVGMLEKERGYWRDIGSIDEYFKANLEVCGASPILNLYNPRWPMHTYMPSALPAKCVHDTTQRNSLIANAVIVSSAHIRESVLFTGSNFKEQIPWNIRKVDDGAVIEESLLLGDFYVGQNCRIYRAIIDRPNCLPPGTIVGVDKDHDLARGFTVSPGGITVVPSNYYQFPNGHR